MKTYRFKISGSTDRREDGKIKRCPVSITAVSNYLIQAGEEIRPQGSRLKIIVTGAEELKGGPQLGDKVVWKGAA